MEAATDGFGNVLDEFKSISTGRGRKSEEGGPMSLVYICPWSVELMEASEGYERLPPCW